MLPRAHLELGGNDAMLVLPGGADVDAAVSAAAFGSFMHAGQTCMTTGRLGSGKVHINEQTVSDESQAPSAV